MKRLFSGGGTSLGLVCILGVVMIAFLPTLRDGFVWDDLVFIVGNPSMHKTGNVLRFLTEGDTFGTEVVNPYYRPLTTMTFALDHWLWGENPAGYHASNLLFHLVASLLVYLCLRRVTAHSVAALFAALLFAAHPAHVEPVSYISARADLLCGLFLTGAFTLHLQRVRSDSCTAGILSNFCYVLALLSKIVAIIFPFMIALHLVLFDKRKKRAWWLLSYAAITIGFLVLRSRVLEMEAWGSVPLEVRVATAGTILVSYLRHALLPFDLRVFYDIPRQTALIKPIVLGSWACLLAVGGLGLVTARRWPWAVFGGAWFFLALFPVSGLITLIYPSFMADRYLYVPLIGAAMIAGRLTDEALRVGPNRGLPRVVWVVPAVIVAGLLLTVHGRLPAWRDSISLWQAAEKDAPANPYVLNCLGWAYKNLGNLEEAQRVLLKAATLAEDNPQIHIQLATIAFMREDPAAAERHTLRALRLNPGDSTALRYLGIVLYRKGYTAQAMAAVKKSILINPNDLYSRDFKKFLEQQAREVQ